MATGRRFLLTCAMTRYQHCPDWNREELIHDVDRVARLFCGDFLQMHARYEHVRVLGDSPTSVELLDGLRDFCTSPQRRYDDYIVVYLTGHGEILDNGDYVVLASDTRPTDLLHRTVPTSELVRLALAGTRVRRLLLLLDTCYSGQGGTDLAREALLRLDQPEPVPDSEINPATASGVVVVAATRPYQQALPGAFTTCLDRAARSLATAGNAPPTLRMGALIGQANADPTKPRTQSSEWHQLRMDDDEPAFLPNPRYRPPLVDVDLLEQERARHNPQREHQFQERFLPAIRWFTGRHRALIDLAAWLKDSKNVHNACVVTGNAGSGKTTLLGLIAALSDPDQAPGVPRQGLPDGLTIPDSVITEAIYAGTMTTEQIRDRIADAAGLRVETVQELIRGLNQRTEDTPIVVMVDALDEAADRAGLVTTLLNHLIRRCPRSIRILLGTRPFLLVPKLLGNPDNGRYQLIDLDAESYADPDSIRDYARRILLSTDSLDSAYTPSGIYQTASEEFVDLVTAALGEAAEKSFLIARITATTEATVTTLPDPADPVWRASLPRRAGEAMRRDLDMRLGDNAQRAAELLLPLAYSQGSGMPWEDIWPRLADALSPGKRYGNHDLVWLRTAAGSYAVEGVADGVSVYRLYHQALVEHLVEGRDQGTDQGAITDVLLAQVPVRAGGQRDWSAAHPYIRTHLATHAAWAGHIENLATDPGFLIAAAPPQLVAALDKADSEPARIAADAYRRAARHLRSKPPREHASYLQLAAHCSRATDLANALDLHTRSSGWSARWASWRYRPPRHTLTGHTERINAVAVAELDSRPVVITASADRTVRVWELATGTPVGAPFIGHTGWVNAVAVAELDSRPVVITGSDDTTVQVWELTTGNPIGNIIRHTGPVNAVTIAKLNGRPVVISAAARTMQVWDLATGNPIGVPFHDIGWVRTVAVTELDDRAVVISGSDDATVRLWDLNTCATVGTPFTGHTGRVNAVAVTELDGRPVVISGSTDRSVQVWDLDTRTPIGDPFTGHTDRVCAVAVTKLDDRPVVISGSADRSVQVWDLDTRTPIGNPSIGHNNRVCAVAVTELDDRPVVISGSADRSVQVWDLDTGTPIGDPFTGHTGWVRAVAVTELDDRPVVISGSADRSVHVWDLDTRTPIGNPSIGHNNRVCAVAVTELDDRPVVISGSADRSVQVWDLDTGTPIGDPFTGHTGWVHAVAVTELDNRPVVICGSADEHSVQVWDLTTRNTIGRIFYLGGGGRVLGVAHLDGHPVMISAGDDATVRVWDLATHLQLGEPYMGHTAPVLAVATGELDGRPVVVSGGEDTTLRVWDLAKRRPKRNILRAVRLRHSAPILTAVTHQNKDHLWVFAGCSDGTIWTWDLSSRRVLSKMHSSHGTAVTAIALLGPERIVFAAGGTLVIGSTNPKFTPDLVIELESEILALTAYDPSTVVAATGLGLVVLDIPRL
jgi:WD40 repeat protein